MHLLYLGFWSLLWRWFTSVKIKYEKKKEIKIHVVGGSEIPAGQQESRHLVCFLLPGKPWDC